MNKIWLLICLVMLLAGCRGEDESDFAAPRFPNTSDPDSFAAFLNPAPAVPRSGVAAGEIDNVKNFPVAYYNTVDPDGSRDTFLKWRIENGFLNADGSAAVCDPGVCTITHATFRDTKDLGYGRNMFMRRDLLNGDVAVFVENFQVDAIPGVPYGPLNFAALVDNDRSWNFGVNAIEFSAFPQTGPDARKFTKFYNFSGEGKRAMLASGSQQHVVDLDSRGTKPMPTPCIVCHGGQGRTLVYRDANNRLLLAPTITGGIPGDVQAQMQTIEFNTLQFADASGFTREENEDDIREINDAILSTYEYRRQNFTGRGDWNADFAIEILNGRYAGNPANPGNRYDASFVPTDWNANDASLYRTLVGPNCMVCHALRGSTLNQSLSFASYPDFVAYSDRIHQLVFEQGKMPLGLLNYADFWDSSTKDPAALAAAIGHAESLDENQRAIRPGKAVAVIAAPPLATGLNTDTGETHPIPISGASSAFVAANGFSWSVEPANLAEVVADTRDEMPPGSAVLTVEQAGEYTLTLNVSGVNGNSQSTESVTIDVRDEATAGAPPPASDINYYGAIGINTMVAGNCTTCHAPGPAFEGIPLHYVPCRSDDFNGHDFVYRSVLARVNFESPLDSLFLRKPINGSTDTRDRQNTIIPGYHGGRSILNSDEDYSLVLSWILNGAPRGDLPQVAIEDTAEACTP